MILTNIVFMQLCKTASTVMVLHRIISS